MNGSLKLVAPLVAALAIAACNAGGSSNMPAGAAGVTPGAALKMNHLPDWAAKHQAKAVCPEVVGMPTCLALKVTGPNGITPACSPSACGITPAELQARYKPPTSNGTGTIVAIIDAFDEPNASSDLATYRSQFGLGTANFAKYNQSGQQSNYPESCAQASPGWCVEEMLDVEMVSAICPNCTIYLVENDGSINGFEAAEKTAVSLGATIVSNSWICYQSWDCGDSTGFPAAFNSSGVEYLAASGDAGYNYIGGPSVLATVTAVGGTQLTKSGSNYSETIWNGAGAGCASSSVVGSPGVAKPSWQKDPSCTYRTDADISAEAGCNPGVAEYDSNEGGWFGVCGTSAASPMSAAMFAVAGNASSLDAAKGFWTLKKKKLKKELWAITSGSDGSCGGSYLCQAGTKQYKTYSGPGGWGTPDGDKAY